MPFRSGDHPELKIRKTEGPYTGRKYCRKTKVGVQYLALCDGFQWRGCGWHLVMAAPVTFLSLAPLSPTAAHNVRHRADPVRHRASPPSVPFPEFASRGFCLQ
jgi:hypothetical protein